MNINTQWPVGQFLTKLEADVTDEQLLALAVCGLRYLGQRNTKVDRILGGFEEKDGKMVRKAGFSRGAVEYSEELAKALSESFGTLEFPDSTKETPHTLEVLVDIQKYEGGGKEPAYAAEKRAVNEYLAANGGKLKSGEARTVESFCANRGIEASTETDWKEDTEFLLRVKAWLKSVASAE